MIYDDLKDVCDSYIERCDKVLQSRNLEDAKKLRSETTLKFHNLIPRWESGLMASITHFYLDDIENIYNKLTNFRKQLEDGTWQPKQIAVKYKTASTKKNAGRRFLTSFDQTIRWVRDNMGDSATHKAEVMDHVQALQDLAEQELSRTEKWEHLKAFLEWLKSEDDELASQMLPLFIEVLETDK